MKITELLYKTKIFYSVIRLLLFFILSGIKKFNKVFKVTDGSIVIVALHRLGDSVFTIPAIKQIQNEYNNELIIFCYSESVPIYKLAINNALYITVERTDFFLGNRVASFEARKKLNKANPSMIIDITGVMTSASLIFNSKAALIVGMNREIFKNIYDKFTPVKYKSHLSEMYLNVANIVSKKNDYTDAIHDSMTINEVDKIIIHPFAGWKAKEWNFNKFILLAEILKKEYEVAILVPSNYLSKEILDEIKNLKIDLIFTSTIEELIKNLKNFSLLIGNDSGPIQIASLLGKATFTLYGPTNPKFTLPIGMHHGFYQNIIKCSPISSQNLCFKDGGRYGCPSFECMNQLSVEKVYEKIKHFILTLENETLKKNIISKQNFNNKFG